jgi:multidrug efflux pump subunit AcrB
MLSMVNLKLDTMSAIGLILMCGIIVNDIILKIGTIDNFLSKGFNLDEAILRASYIRFRPILMTSITTILAVIPLIMSTGIGVEFQKPLIISLLGGLILGTLAAIFLVPFLYFGLFRYLNYKSGLEDN